MQNEHWSLFGVVATEDRCTATVNAMQNKLDSKRFIKIIDPHSEGKPRFDKKFEKVEQQLFDICVDSNEIQIVGLLDDIDTIRDQVENFMVKSNPNIVLDITSMPKRWFFPVIRFILAERRVNTLIVTYSAAKSYEDKLSLDPESLQPLPTFGETEIPSCYEELVIAVGYNSLSLRELFEIDILKVRYLFPFPPGPPGYLRNWRFLQELDKEVRNHNVKEEDRFQISAYDVSGAFEALGRFTDNGRKPSVFAPYGPKTLSLSMCLFALAVEKAGKNPVNVLYTQPRQYSLNYTTGVGHINGQPDIKAYCLRIDGRDIYSL